MPGNRVSVQIPAGGLTDPLVTGLKNKRFAPGAAVETGGAAPSLFTVDSGPFK